jgi:hypothetical protein
MKRILKDNERILIVFLAVAVLLTLASSAQDIGGFSFYKPYDNLNFRWNDPNMDIDYPYRTIFLVGTNTGGSNYGGTLLFLYSKKPTTDIFSFRYQPLDGQKGYIAAYFNWREFGTDTDSQALRLYSMTTGMLDGRVNAGVSDIDETGGNVDYTTKPGGGFYFDNKDTYFKFDFIYDCASLHGGGISDLQITGLGGVSNMPYDYIIACKSHESQGGGGTGVKPPGGGGQGGGGGGDDGGGGDGGDDGGGDDGGGGNNPGGGNGGGSGGYGGGDDGNEPPPSNGEGEGGRHGWGDGPWGGGLIDDNIKDPFEGEETDWKDPWIDDYNDMPGEYTPEIPPYTPGTGDTGEDGSDWDLPEIDVDDHGVTGEPEGYVEFEPPGEEGLIPLEPGGVQDDAEFVPGGEYGLIDFMNPYYL